MGPYSPYKALYHCDSIEKLRRGEQPAPKHVQLVITNRCRLHCRFCAYRMPGYSSSECFDANHVIPMERAKNLLVECAEAGVKAIQFTGGGEPSCHPDFMNILSCAVAMGFEVALVTNGLYLPGEFQEVLPKLAWVRYSVDAGEPETYRAIKDSRKKDFELLMDQIRAAVVHKGPCRVGAGFVVTKENWREILAFTDRMKELGVDNVRLSAVFQNEGARYFESCHAPVVSICRQAEARQTPEFQVWNNFGDRLADLEQQSPDYEICGQQYFCTYIGADLNLYRCCVLAYSHRGWLGSVAECEFDELWYSEPVIRRMKEFSAPGCQRCQFNAKNRLIGYAVGPHPIDVNFV